MFSEGPSGYDWIFSRNGPVDSKGENIFSLFKDEDRKLRIKDPKRYPTKSFIISSFAEHLRFKHEIFGKIFGDNDPSILKKNILDTYRLVDENGLEITLEELADRYFSDAETCFIKDFNEEQEKIF